MRLDEFYNPQEDKGPTRTIQDTRKGKLTLEELNKLRKYREIKTAEESEHDEFVRTMYAQPAGDQAAGGGLV